MADRYGFVLDKKAITSSSTVTTYLEPASFPMRGLTLTNTLTADFSVSSLFIIIINILTLDDHLNKIHKYNTKLSHSRFISAQENEHFFDSDGKMISSLLYFVGIRYVP